MPVGMPDTKVTASPPKLRQETPIKQKPDNPPDSVRHPDQGVSLNHQ